MITELVVEFVLTLLIAAFLWPAVIRWWRQLDAAAALDTLRPTAAEVAMAEAQLPTMPDPRDRVEVEGQIEFDLNEQDVEFMDAVARYREGLR